MRGAAEHDQEHEEETQFSGYISTQGDHKHGRIRTNLFMMLHVKLNVERTIFPEGVNVRFGTRQTDQELLKAITISF